MRKRQVALAAAAVAGLLGLAQPVRAAETTQTVLVDGPSAAARCATSYPGVTGPDQLSGCQ